MGPGTQLRRPLSVQGPGCKALSHPLVGLGGAGWAWGWEEHYLQLSSNGDGESDTE